VNFRTQTEPLVSFYEVLYGRRSVRRYEDRPLPAGLLTRLLDAACQAPSAHNSQPWRFVVVARGERRDTLAARMGARFREDLRRDGLSDAEAEAQVERSRQRIGSAPALVVACLTTEEMERYPDATRQALEVQMGVQSVAAAIQNLLLAAQAEGIAACWMCAPLFCPDIVLEVLELPRHWQPQAFITLGYASAPPQAKPLAPLDSRIFYR
jgi:coenzyme F420-0:L-glutamate ligase/coenzyme F420-1:gamma-L-glutamate ligase